MELQAVVFILAHFLTIATFTRCAQIPSIKRSATIFTKEPTVRIQCLSGSMLITIKDAPANLNGQFSGMVYPKGLAKNSTCLTEYRDQEAPLRYKLPLKSCNTMPIETDDGGIEFFNTIVLQPHLKLVTDLGRGYHVRCRYKSREAAMKPSKSRDDNRPLALTSAEGTDRRDYGRSMDKDHAVQEEDVKPMPACHMKIFTGEKLAENVKIGDPLTLVINIDKQDTYGLHVTDCLVRDGLGWGEQRLINDEGCPLDSEILGPFEYTEEQTKATVTFPAHKFPYTNSVYYQCNVKLCALDDPDCHKIMVGSEATTTAHPTQIKVVKDGQKASHQPGPSMRVVKAGRSMLTATEPVMPTPDTERDVGQIPERNENEARSNPNRIDGSSDKVLDRRSRKRKIPSEQVMFDDLPRRSKRTRKARLDSEYDYY